MLGVDNITMLWNAKKWPNEFETNLLKLVHKIINIPRKAQTYSLLFHNVHGSCRQHTSYTILFCLLLFLSLSFSTVSDSRHERIEPKCLFALVCRSDGLRAGEKQKENTVNVINEYEAHCCERKNCTDVHYYHR